MLRSIDQLGDRDRLAGAHGVTERSVIRIENAVLAALGLIDAVGLDEVEATRRRVIGIDQDRVGMRDLQRAAGYRGQHGVEIERGRDRTADLFQHLQLIDRLRQITGALFDLGLQHRVGLRDLPSHAVELIGELFQLVMGAHLDAAPEVPGAEPARAGPQRGDRHQHTPRQHCAGERRHHQAEPDQQRAAQQLVADRRQCLRGRLLEHDSPAELRNHG